MAMARIFFDHAPSEQVEKYSETEKKITVKGRNHQAYSYDNFQVGDTVDWDGHAFVVSYIGAKVIFGGHPICDVEITAIVKNNSAPLNSSAIKKIIEEEKAAKALKISALKEKAKERRKLKKEQEQKLKEQEQKLVEEVALKHQSTIGSLEL